MQEGSDCARNKPGIDASSKSTGGCSSVVDGGGSAFDSVRTSSLHRIVGISIKSLV